MPCRSDYMEPTQAEIRSNKTAKLILYVREVLPSLESSITLKDKYLANLHAAAGNSYGNVSQFSMFTATLCKMISEMTDEQKEKFMFDGRNPRARELAAWSEQHEREDRARDELKARIEAQNLTLQIEEASGELFEQVEALLVLLPDLAHTVPGARLSAIVKTIRGQ